MDASRAATGMSEVLAIRTVRSISEYPVAGSFNSGNSLRTSVISLPRSPHPILDHDISLGPLGQLVLDHCFAGPEGPRYRSHAAPRGWETWRRSLSAPSQEVCPGAAFLYTAVLYARAISASAASSFSPSGSFQDRNRLLHRIISLGNGFYGSFHAVGHHDLVDYDGRFLYSARSHRRPPLPVPPPPKEQNAIPDHDFSAGTSTPLFRRFPPDTFRISSRGRWIPS